MYYPYFRGKQYELISIRECAEMISEAGFVPIVEPVKESLNGLARAIDAVVEADGSLVLIVNPVNGDLSGDSAGLIDFLDEKYAENDSVSAGILLAEDFDLNEVERLREAVGDRQLTFIHAGFSDGKGLADLISGWGECSHVFIDNYSGKLYRRHFNGSERILVKDGFQKRANRLHPPIEFFSDLHVVFVDEGADGFGDFLIAGDDYSEGGGPAYAVAIHLTFIDQEKDDEMYIHHFKSDRVDTPTDPAGKFAEALRKLVEEVQRPGSKILRTEAVEEFLSLHARGHFPGLGYVKKLSMQHHIETLANYFQGRE